jgi:transposase-like protein
MLAVWIMWCGTMMDEGSYEARRSAPKDRVQVTVRTERRRRWSAEEKLGIVRETLRPGGSAR